MRHPWQLTWREFLDLARHYYGIEILGLSLGPRGLVLSRKGVLLSLQILSEEEVLTEGVLRAACRSLGIPPEDFGLAPEDDEET